MKKNIWFRGTLKNLMYSAVQLCLQAGETREELLEEVNGLCDHFLEEEENRNQLQQMLDEKFEELKKGEDK